jgi:radical SAM superfamily enzyme YgiQ (UPF0313 family)
LRFLKQNIPKIEILEHPSWNEYQKKVNQEKWDVVGFSFYLNEIHEILDMVNYARKRNIPELWAGNYGALTESIQKKFDRVFIGYCENEIANILGKQVSNKDIIHPPITTYVSYYGFKLTCQGYLFTNRGCNFRCNFCQTPVFCKKPCKIPIDSIENVLKYYKKLGINELIIPDESFGLFKNHAEEVVDLLDKYGFYWIPMVRADILKERLDDWHKKGLIGVLVGIENFNQNVLDSIGKKEKIEEILNVVKSLKKKNKFIDGLYMIGFPEETADSIKQDIKKVAALKMDITQLCVITPLPGTPLWRDIEEKYGIFDKDWHHYNAKHLVWNHPNIKPREMRDILMNAFKIIYPPIRVFETSIGFTTRYIGYRGIGGGLKYLLRQSIHANTFNFYQKRFFPDNDKI